MEQASHVSLSMPAEQPTGAASTADNFQFMSDTFTLPQDGQTRATQATTSQGYAGKFLLGDESLENAI